MLFYHRYTREVHDLCAVVGLLLILARLPASGQPRIFTFDGDTLPGDGGWTPIQIWCSPSQLVQQGWLYMRVEACPPYPPPSGQLAAYHRLIDEYVGSETFFLEWRAETDAATSELVWGGGVIIAAGGTGPTFYHFSVVRDQVRMIRDNRLPILFAPLLPGVPHRYRLELVGATSYEFYIDDQVVEQGVPEGPYPDLQPEVTWSVRATYFPNTTRWDYIRYGVIPQDAGGDYDSDGDIDPFDAHYFFECFDGMPDELAAGVTRGPQRPSGPSCRWADMDSDGDTDLLDFAQFSARYTGRQLTPEEIRPAVP